MPELPEVQTIVDELNQKVVGRKIAKIKILSPKSFVGDKKDIKSIREKIITTLDQLHAEDWSAITRESHSCRECEDRYI